MLRAGRNHCIPDGVWLGLRDRDREGAIVELRDPGILLRVPIIVPGVLQVRAGHDEEGHEVYKYCSEAKKNHSGRKFRDVSTDSSSSDSEYLDDKNDDDIDDEDVDDSSELVGLSARELSSLGGFDLVTSGDAIALLCTGGPSFPKGDMGELRYFKVRKL